MHADEQSCLKIDVWLCFSLQHVHLGNVFLLRAILAIFAEVAYTIDDLTKYRRIPVSRYFCDGILSSGIS